MVHHLQADWGHSNAGHDLIGLLKNWSASPRTSVIRCSSLNAYTRSRKRSLLQRENRLTSKRSLADTGYSSCGPSETNLGSLPDELLLLILQQCDAITVCNARRVSRRWNLVAGDNSVWQDLCGTDFGLDVRKEDESWADAYNRTALFLMNPITMEGNSHWVEPKGFEYNQLTTMEVKLDRRLRSIRGTGATTNRTIRKRFSVVGVYDGRRVSFEKLFDHHSCTYEGLLSFTGGSGTFKGTIVYQLYDRRWQGVFELQLSASFCAACADIVPRSAA